MDKLYVKLEDQSSFTGDKKALQFLPEEMRRKAQASPAVMAPPETTTPSGGADSQRLNLAEKARSASELSQQDLMVLLEREFKKARETPRLQQEFHGLGQTDLFQKLAAGAQAVATGAETFHKTLDPEAAKKAEEEKLAQQRQTQLRIAGGLAVLGLLTYFLFFRK